MNNFILKNFEHIIKFSTIVVVMMRITNETSWDMRFLGGRVRKVFRIPKNMHYELRTLVLGDKHTISFLWLRGRHYL